MSRIISITHSLEVRDLAVAREWYSRLLGRAPDLEPVPGVLEWELFPSVWLQVAEGENVEATAQMLRLGVEDIDVAVSELSAADIDVGVVERVEGTIAFCEFADPSGNRLSIYQEL
jgi:catechol 2,3-dioxygenase-like lactoylglutathione lyase family enzyme